MSFHKHPVNFDVCKYLTHCSGLKSSTDRAPSPSSNPRSIDGPGRGANGTVVCFDGSPLNTSSLFWAGAISGNNAYYVAHFTSVFSHLLDSVKYFFITQSSKTGTYLGDPATGSIKCSTTSRRLTSCYTEEGNISYLGQYGVNVYHNGSTRVMCGLTAEDFDEEKNEYTLLDVNKSGPSYIYTDIMYNGNNGNTQIRVNFTATATTDTAIKGLVLYTVMHRAAGGYNVALNGTGENAECTAKNSDTYMINLGYVEFDTPIEAKANIPFTVDVIFEFET